MWICSLIGFYSITKREHRGVKLSRDRWQVRSRARVDLVNLKRECPSMKDCTIIETKDSDYRFRIFVKKPQLDEMFKYFADHLEYAGFKNHIAADPGQADRHAWYLNFWMDGNDYQKKKYEKPKPIVKMTKSSKKKRKKSLQELLNADPTWG